MVITYSKRSRIGAMALKEQDDAISIARRDYGDINWGRAMANTRLNPDISNATNKRRMRELFVKHGVPAPKYYGYLLPLDVKFPVVGRPDSHMKGKGFWLCKNWYDVHKARKGTKKKAPATHFMEFVDAPREYRVHVFRDKSIRISEKAHTAFHVYTTVKPTHNVDHIRRAAKQAVKALGLDFGAVDVLADNDNCWVLEVNTAPGLGGSTPRVYAEAFKKWEKGEW